MIFYLIWWNIKLSNVIGRWTNQVEDSDRNGETYTSKKVRITIPRFTIETSELIPDANGVTIEGINSDIHIKEYRRLATEKVNGKLHSIETSQWAFVDQVSPQRFLSQCCPFEYRGPLCGYTGSGYTIDGEPTTKEGPSDICSRTTAACKLRFGNKIPFGGILF